MDAAWKNKVLQLIAEGRVEQALSELSGLSNEVLMLQFRYHSVSLKIRLGTISNNDSAIELSRINHTLLEFLRRLDEDDFEHYKPYEIYLLSHAKDNGVKFDIEKRLRKKGFSEIVDAKNIEISQKLDTFLNKNLLTPEFIVVLVSINSLTEGWESLERYTDLVSNVLTHPHCIVLALDRSYEAENFVFQQLEKIELSIESLYNERAQNKERSTDQPMQLAALTNQKNHLPRIVQRLRQINVVDIVQLKTEAIVDVIQQHIDKRSAASRIIKESLMRKPEIKKSVKSATSNKKQQPAHAKAN